MASDTDNTSKGTTSGAASDRETTRPKKPYVTPELIEYGSVAKLTQAGGQTVQDFLFWRRMRNMSMCL